VDKPTNVHRRQAVFARNVHNITNLIMG